MKLMVHYLKLVLGSLLSWVIISTISSCILVLFISFIPGHCTFILLGHFTQQQPKPFTSQKQSPAHRYVASQIPFPITKDNRNNRGEAQKTASSRYSLSLIHDSRRLHTGHEFCDIFYWPSMTEFADAGQTKWRTRLA